MELNDALIAARHGRALAFLGSGFSLGAVAANGLEIPTTSTLAARLCAEIEEDELPFDVAAGLYRRCPPRSQPCLRRVLQIARSDSTTSATLWMSILRTSTSHSKRRAAVISSRTQRLISKLGRRSSQNTCWRKFCLGPWYWKRSPPWSRGWSASARRITDSKSQRLQSRQLWNVQRIPSYRPAPDGIWTTRRNGSGVH